MARLALGSFAAGLGLPGPGLPDTNGTGPVTDDRRQRGLDKMSEVYGWDVQDGPGDFFAITVDHLFAEIWSRPGLSMRDRRLLLLGLLTGQGLQDVADIQIGAALRTGRAEPGRAARDRDLPDPLRGLAGRRPAQHAGREAHRRARQGATARAATRRLKEQGMRHGVVLFSSDRGITPAHAAAAAEAAGFACFYVPEHTHIPVRRDAVHPGTGTAELPDDRYLRTLDPWVALSMAAAVTSTIRLGTAVALPAEHDPITLAKTIASLDHLSGGRVELGVGFGWNTDELADHGVPPGKRRTVLREHLEAMRALWSEDEASYQGEFVSFGASWAWPKPAQPRIPVLVGAGGTEKTFRWIAQLRRRLADHAGRDRPRRQGRAAAQDLAGGRPRRRAPGHGAGGQAGPGTARALGRHRRDRRGIRPAGPLPGRGRRLPRPAGRAPGPGGLTWRPRRPRLRSRSPASPGRGC